MVAVGLEVITVNPRAQVIGSEARIVSSTGQAIGLEEPVAGLRGFGAVRESK